METIAFVDSEIQWRTKTIMDIGAVRNDGRIYHGASVAELAGFLRGARYVCGHNIIHHDLKVLQSAVSEAGIGDTDCIDTLYWSPLLFPQLPYHALVKDDKLQADEANNPLNDAVKARELFQAETAAFRELPPALQDIYCVLLRNRQEFGAFFAYLGYAAASTEDPASLIRRTFLGSICSHAELYRMVEEHPVELAYALALIHTRSRYSITPPWVLRNFPETERVFFQLRNIPCRSGCPYCKEAMDVHKGLNRFFGFDRYREYGGEPLQERAVQAAVANRSLLAVFPTGGGKSLTFQVPALMSGFAAKGLTVVISPLQSLMKDQVDNLERAGMTDAVTINGLLDPVERAKSFQRVENGSASLLYISPESLRSSSIERLLLGRNVVRFVIDEAHCFSSWGQDFRVDYLYIGDFIKQLQEKKNSPKPIPVSCFTATAKQKVIEDIRDYFQRKLGLELELFATRAGRTNLRYTVLPIADGQEKYQTLRQLLESHPVPSIIYVSRTRRAEELAERLTADGYAAKAYHGRMDKRDKAANQDAFIRGEVSVMVATSAFGMGVDKKDVGLVVHYEISDSLENYVQEAGRAGRDAAITADCYVLFHEEDLNKHFIMLNQTKLSIREIQQVWKALKDLTRFRAHLSQSALEIARQAGWDDSVMDIEGKVKTAVAALEEAGYVKRGCNRPRIFASGIIARNAMEANSRIRASGRFDDKQKEQAVRIIQKLLSTKSRKHASQEIPESRVDYISDHLGIRKEEVIRVIQLLREEGILADTKDLTAYVRRRDLRNKPMAQLKVFRELEQFLEKKLEGERPLLNLKELNEEAEAAGIKEATPDKFKTLLNIWVIQQWVKRLPASSPHYFSLECLAEPSALAERAAKRHELATFIVEQLQEKALSAEEDKKEEALVEFSILELKEAYEFQPSLFHQEANSAEIEDALFYLSRIGSIKLEGGFLVTYNSLTLERLELDNKRRYKQEDYQKLEQFYQSKVQQVHIVGEYAERMIRHYRDALQFVDDYFQMNYTAFLNKYFKASRQEEIRRTITPGKFRQLFGELSAAQLGIINDRDSRCIVVMAGPGSGKTRLLVHKLASLMLMEDVKHEQMLMLTFSRAAATEFKKRLLALVGNAAHYIEIKTFHSYCFDLLGKIGSLEKSDAIIRETVDRIREGNVEPSRITKTVLVLDEAQDMNAEEYELVETLMVANEEMRVIAVGDDDQNIYEFRGSRSAYMAQLLEQEGGRRYELVDNYRSRANLVAFANSFAEGLPERLKRTPIQAVQQQNGTLRVIRTAGDNLITPLVRAILAEREPEAEKASEPATVGVLVHTNEEALQICAMLSEQEVPARLVQSNEGFNLFNLLEIRYLLRELKERAESHRIAEEKWEEAMARFRERFAGSAQLEPCLRMLGDFAAVQGERLYMSDLESFVRESKLEDFAAAGGDTVQVSTIHKAKGREFDSVFLLLKDMDAGAAPVRREIYVAMTRAKRQLSIHYNGFYLQRLEAEGLERLEDNGRYPSLTRIVLQLGHRDLWLDYCMSCQAAVSLLRAGDALQVEGRYAMDSCGRKVLHFSRQLLDKLDAMRGKGYEPAGGQVRYMVFWQKENAGREILIPLPELVLERTEQYGGMRGQYM